jgi:type I restriction enzyme S subunit
MTFSDDLDCRGVKWMGTIPGEWCTHAVKRYYDIQLGKMLQNNAASEKDLLVPYAKALHVNWGHVCTEELPEMWASPSDVEQYGIRAGDLLVCEGGEVGRAGIVSTAPDNCIIQNALHRVRSKDDADLRFLKYVLHAVSNAGWFDVLCNKATISHFTREKFTDLRIPAPDPTQQNAIAAFLDRETLRIDALIAKKERQIELLQEKRAALISHVVTDGLDPNTKMKDSGIRWLGKVPGHWRICRAKVLFREINERSSTGTEELLTVSHITGITRRSEKNVTMFLAESLEDYKKCQPGDLVINTMWAWMGALGFTAEAGIVSPSYNVYRPRTQDIEPGFYDYLFRTGKFIAEIICHSQGVWTSRLRLYPEEFFEIRIPHPPIEEQREIVARIQKETGNYTALQEKIEQSIETIREYRSALITAAVTGKIDVRGEVT